MVTNFFIVRQLKKPYTNHGCKMQLRNLLLSFYAPPLISSAINDVNKERWNMANKDSISKERVAELIAEFGKNARFR